MNGIIRTVAGGKWVLDWDLFEGITDNMGFHTDALRAEAIDMHPSSLSKIRYGVVRPGRKFIEGTADIGIPFSAIFVRSTTPAAGS